LAVLNPTMSILCKQRMCEDGGKHQAQQPPRDHRAYGAAWRASCRQSSCLTSPRSVTLRAHFVRPFFSRAEADKRSTDQVVVRFTEPGSQVQDRPPTAWVDRDGCATASQSTPAGGHALEF
jgi:hypothetical protein